ncbi:MAG TPA: hypothetical protein VIF57_08940 [Polyangia bacterium]|jgi:hypothetical protein
MIRRPSFPPVRTTRAIAALLSFCAAGCGGGSAAPDASGAAGASGGTAGAAGGTAGGTGGSGTGGGAGTAAGTSVATGEDRPGAVAVDGSFVYWTTATAIRRAPKAGGSATTLFSSQGAPDTLVVDGANLYWRNASTPNGIFTGPATGGQAAMVVGGLPSAFALDADSVYWLDAGDLMLRRASKAPGGTPQMLAGPGNFGLLVLDDQYLYWAETGARVRRIAKTGGDINELRPADATPGLRARWTVLDDTYIYFATDTSSAQSGALMRVPKAGGAGDTLASALDTSDAIALGGDAVYWLTRGDSGPGYVARIPKTGGAAAMIASGFELSIGIAVDAQYVYWTEAGDFGARNGRVQRVPR